jgi:arylamine N-acetyltransferase
MAHHPLDPPQDRSLLDLFLARFGLCADQSPRRLLREMAAAFTALPYENLTKIIKEDEAQAAPRARRQPAEVLADHIRHGAGGTCFSLTAALLHLLRAAGWQAEPLLADRRYGDNTHCALLVWIDGRPHLLDPGYLILDPISLDAAGETRIVTNFNEVVLTPQPSGEKLALSTINMARQQYRLTYKTSPADPGEFLKAWDASFDWDMMHYPVLSRICGDRQLYLQGDRLQTRSHTAIQREEIADDELVRRIAGEFGIDAHVVSRALAILKRKGEL